MITRNVIKSRGGAALGLALLLAAAGPSAAEAATCVAAALNLRGEQIAGTRSVTIGLFPRIVCARALNRCERRLAHLRAQSGRDRPFAGCEVVRAGLIGAAADPGPPLERPPAPYVDGYAPAPYPPAEVYDVPRRLPPRVYDDAPYLDTEDDLGAAPEYDAAPRDDDLAAAAPPAYRVPPPPRPDAEPYDPGAAYRGPDARRFDEFGVEDRSGRAFPGAADAQEPFADDGFEARQDRCNYQACSARYLTFRSSDCSYKPTVDTRRRCQL